MFTTRLMKEVIFPEDFIFGAGGAGHQIEGNNIHSQFHEWETTRDCFPVRAGKACNCWEMYQEDIELFKRLGWQIYRMSIEWSRIEPEQGVYDFSALKRYLDMLERLNNAGIKVSLTCHHWSHPLWFEKLGGFGKRENIKYFLRHLDFLVPKIKDYVFQWNVLNEFTNHGTNPKSFDLMKNLTVAHALGYHTIKKYSNAPVSSTHALIHWQPYRSYDEFDRIAAKTLDWATNGYFIHALETGELVLPYTEAEFVPELKDALDYWAINYYTRHMASGRTENLTTHRFEFDRVSMVNGDSYHEEFYPDAFVQHLPRFKNKPVWICENGVSADDDRFRILYLARHFAALKEAMELGVDLRGYIHWSAMDNYEWGNYFPRFGLIEVDRETFERRPKPSSSFYKEIIEAHGITDAIRKKWLEPLCDWQTYNFPIKKGS
ncbi:MAG: glycoside hydrolase family 1 protein [Lentisphaeria bacterium]|nr:glycoside hydrolase family 1 protein [Lentisphaeria bacterium]